MEGKEVRFGIANSALFATITTDASCGRGERDARFADASRRPCPAGQHPPRRNHLCGVGAGMYGMLIFVVLTVFIAGLMVGRTPEYLGKKVEASTYRCRCSTSSSFRW